MKLHLQDFMGELLVPVNKREVAQKWVELVWGRQRMSRRKEAEPFAACQSWEWV